MSGEVHKNHRARMRKRFIEHGAKSLEDHELLELLLYYAVPRGDVNPLAHRLIEEFGSFANVLDAQTGDLCRVRGIGESAAALLHLVPALFQRYRLSKVMESAQKRFDTQEKIAELLVSYYVDKTNEQVVALLLDNSCRLLRLVEIGQGGPASVTLDMRRLLQILLQSNASQVVLAHNHPRGDCRASRADIRETSQMRDLLARIGVTLTDHIIVAEGRCVSMAAQRIFSS